MNKDIKKILRTIKYCAGDYMKQEEGVQCFEWSDLWVLNEYIEKLQQENQQLRNALEKLKDSAGWREILELSGIIQENQQLKEVIDEVREDIVFCINGMKNEFACTDSRTNRELHTMVKILEDRLQILDKAKETIK